MRRSRGDRPTRSGSPHAYPNGRGVDGAPVITIDRRLRRASQLSTDRSYTR
jgi:hypothetical protein